MCPSPLHIPNSKPEPSLPPYSAVACPQSAAPSEPSIKEGEDSEASDMGGNGEKLSAGGAGSNTGVSSWVKLSLLILLCLQNALYTMQRRYSKGILQETWSTSSVLMVGEIIKLVFSTIMTLSDTGSTSAEGTGVSKLLWLVRASAPMSVPAVVFWIMNLLSYVSLGRVDASTFTVCAQMKILTTAVFSVILMGRRFHARKWRALFLLVLGVTLVSYGSSPTSQDGNGNSGAIGLQYIIGVAAVMTEVTLSGFVGVFFEKVLKSRVVNLSVWDRNFQLAMYSIVLYLISNLWSEGAVFEGWTVHAVVASVLGSVGGLMVALTMKYTDAVLKTFATSGAIIVTAVSGHFLLGQPLDIPIGIGAGCTVLSLLNYSDDGDTLSVTDKKDADKVGLASAMGNTSPGAMRSSMGGTGKAGMDADDAEASETLLSRSGSQNVSAV